MVLALIVEQACGSSGTNSNCNKLVALVLVSRLTVLAVTVCMLMVLAVNVNRLMVIALAVSVLVVLALAVYYVSWCMLVVVS